MNDGRNMEDSENHSSSAEPTTGDLYKLMQQFSADLADARKEQKRDIKTLKRNIKTLNSDIEKLTGALAETQDAVVDIQDRLTTAEKTAAETQEDIRKIDRKYQATRQDLESLVSARRLHEGNINPPKEVLKHPTDRYFSPLKWEKEKVYPPG